MSQLNYLLNLLQPKLNFDSQAIDKLMINYEKNLSAEDKMFIDAKSKELMTIDEEIETSVSEDGLFLFDDAIKKQLLELQFNILNLFLRKKLPNCDKALNSIFGTITKKIAVVNQILQNNLLSTVPVKSERIEINYSQPEPSKFAPNLSRVETQQIDSSQSEPSKFAPSLSRVETQQIASSIKLDSKEKLIKYLNDFNTTNSINDSPDPLPEALKTKLLDGIDNPKYKEAIETIIRDIFGNNYSYTTIFSLPEAVESELQDESAPVRPAPAAVRPAPTQAAVRPAQPAPAQAAPAQAAQAAPAVDFDIDTYVGEFISRHKLDPNDSLNKAPLSESLKTDFIKDSNIANNSEIMGMINQKPQINFSRDLLTTLRGL